MAREQMHEPPLADQGAACAESAARALIVEQNQNFLSFCGRIGARVFERSQPASQLARSGRLPSE